MALVPSKSHGETTVLKRTKYGGWEGGKNDIEKNGTTSRNWDMIQKL